MISAVIGGSGQDAVTVTYMTSQGLTALSAADFTSNSSGEVGDTIDPPVNNTIIVRFLNALTGDTSLTYAGTVVNFVHPQTINY